jgi:hypothetical protein
MLPSCWRISVLPLETDPPHVIGSRCYGEAFILHCRALISSMAMIAAVMSTIAYAEIDTEHLFGFLTGTDIGEVGEKEVESETTGQFG